MILPKKRSVILRFVLFSCGYFLTYGAYFAVLFLQSSINIEGGVGATSATVVYTSSVFFNLFITPLVIRAFGPKWAVVASHIGYLLYVLANFYPVSYLLYTASVATGFAEATMWPNMILFSVHFGRQYGEHDKGDPKTHESDFIGYFFMGFQLSQIFANLLSYGILYGGESKYNTTATLSNVSLTNLSVCGINDCQDPNVTLANMDRYLPTSQAILFVVIGVMSGLILLAITLHSIFTKDIDPSQTSSNDNFSKKAISTEELATSNEEVNKDVRIKSESSNQSKLALLKSTARATLRHVSQFKLWLVAPLALYSGVLMAYSYSELTRAFSACMVGVHQVGLVMAIFAAAGGFATVIMSKLVGIVGFHLPVAVTFLTDICGYIICLFWIPTSENLWVVFVIFAVAGVATCSWQALTVEIHAYLFPESKDIAFTIWNTFVLSGFAIQYGWSTSLCVYLKIYVQLGLLCFSCIGYVIAMVLDKKEKTI